MLVYLKKMANKAVSISLISTMFFASACSYITPKPLGDSERIERVQSDITNLFNNQEPITGPIDIYEAMARAVVYNKDKRLKMMEQVLSEQRLETVSLDVLPDIVGSAGYNNRNNFRGSSSQSLTTGLQSLETSTSENRDTTNADLTFSWNLLDLGVSYVRAKQEADKTLIARERHLKVIQNVIMDVRDAYYRAAAAQKLLPKTKELISEVEAAISQSEEANRQRLSEPTESLGYQRELLEKLQELNDMHRRLALAKTELAALINLRPGADYEVVTENIENIGRPKLPGTIEEFEIRALVDRPELREEDYQKRINVLEVKRVMVQMLPGISLDYGVNYNSNTFLQNNDWYSFSANISKNLFDIFTAPSNLKLAKAGGKVSDARRVALSMAVLAQVHIAKDRFGLAQEDLDFAEKLYRVDSKLGNIAENQLSTGSQTKLEYIKSSTNKVVSELGYYLAYADLQNAYGRMLNSIGFSPLGNGERLDSLQGVAESIKQSEPFWGKRGEQLPSNILPPLGHEYAPYTPVSPIESPNAAPTPTPTLRDDSLQPVPLDDGAPVRLRDGGENFNNSSSPLDVHSPSNNFDSYRDSEVEQPNVINPQDYVEDEDKWVK